MIGGSPTCFFPELKGRGKDIFEQFCPQFWAVYFLFFSFPQKKFFFFSSICVCFLLRRKEGPRGKIGLFYFKSWGGMRGGGGKLKGKNKKNKLPKIFFSLQDLNFFPFSFFGGEKKIIFLHGVFFIICVSNQIKNLRAIFFLFFFLLGGQGLCFFYTWPVNFFLLGALKFAKKTPHIFLLHFFLFRSLLFCLFFSRGKTK